MGYLERRISFLIRELEQGRIHFAAELLETEDGLQLKKDLNSIQRLPNGNVDLSSCSPLVRSTARSLYLFKQVGDEQKHVAGVKNTKPANPDAISRAMREYFQLLEDFFIEATGIKPEKFAIEMSFSERIRKDAKKLAAKAQKAWETYIPQIMKFHSENSAMLLGAGRVVGGLRSIIGGSSRFPEAAFDGLRKFALYADTIFIPDPILPWVEVDRSEERFRHANLLRSCHDLLRIKPLIDANLPYPAVIVFPSWEKSLEDSDEATQDGISFLILDFFSHYLNATFEDESEIFDYVRGTGRFRFREAVDQYQLFYPPGADHIVSFDAAVDLYKRDIAVWRSKEWIDFVEESPPELVVLIGIIERITPQFHVRDNAYTFAAQPLFWLEPHFHYFRLCSEAGNNELRDVGLLETPTLAALQSLLQPNLAWLGNASIQDIVRLRGENQNEEFRRKLSSYIEVLSSSEVDDLDRVSTEVLRGIAALLVAHDMDARRIDEEYRRKHLATIGVGILTAAVALYPWLAPALGTSALLVPLGKASTDFYNQFRDRQTLARSLTGMLSQSKQKA